MKPANALKITSLEKGWCDKDFVMLHACFQLLKDCVEKEDLFGRWDTKGNLLAASQKRELRKLYRWWLKRHRKEIGVSYSPAGLRGYEHDTAKLLQLIQLRHQLWT